MSLQIARVAGIAIRIHVTFLLLVGLVALGSTAPGGPGLVAGMAWLVALFACVVLHELSHSLVARRYGIPISEIELLPIGGVSKMTRAPDDPAVELRIAAAGPLASAVVGLSFAALSVLARVDVWPPTLYGGAFLARLAWVNLLLAGFNLVPALPLDGGRVLRARLEARSDRATATRVAARVARIAAAGMVVSGALVNLWLLVIGVFVYLGSRAEETVALIHERIKDVRVGDIMIREPTLLPAAADAVDVARVIWQHPQREFPVVDGAGAYVGLVTATKLLGATHGQTVGELTDPSVPTLAAADLVESTGLLSGDLPAAVVLRDGQILGLVRADDAALAARHLMEASTRARR